MKEHQTGKGAKFIRGFGFGKLLYHEKQPTKSKALKREAQLKSWSRTQKGALMKISKTKILLFLVLFSLPAYAGAKMITTPTGLKYMDEKVGTGAEAVKDKTVSVHYTGWLDDNGNKGKKFDSSLDRKEPFIFQLGAGQVIQGWDQGVAGMKVGGKRTLMIPSTLAYGARGAGGVIPPNANLIFDVELLAVK
jgi:peptidylprolyl isomerase